MERRQFIKSLGAAAILPAMPLPSITPPVPAAAATFSAHTYQWAEMIVRAHNKCNLGLLQRSLQINEITASALKKQLIENGIVSAQANAYGIHTATRPLYEGAFMNVSEAANSTGNLIAEASEQAKPTKEAAEDTALSHSEVNAEAVDTAANDAELEDQVEANEFDEKVVSDREAPEIASQQKPTG